MSGSRNSQKNADILTRIGEIVEAKDELLIILHTHPDPDAIASAAALQYLVRECFGAASSIAYSGIIARAENRSMVKRLGIRLKQYNRLKLSRFDCCALIDTQPGAGNNAVNSDSGCDIIIDHHPRRRDTSGALVLVNPDIGATATILVGLLKEAGLEIPADLATALAYGINSETQNMHREAAREDIQAYLYVYVRASIRKYAEIINANLPHYYFLQLGRALDNARIYRNLITTHLTKIYHPEIVAEMADFLLKHERISTVLSSGVYKHSLIISIRTNSDKLNAGELIKKLPLDRDNVGGHDKTAGGFIVLESLGKKSTEEAVARLTEAFGTMMGYEAVQWRPLMEKEPR
jgi:nanoRNase/pAp phosphatase (c-di-AMP/oligoRNAs hydrolase)